MNIDLSFLKDKSKKIETKTLSFPKGNYSYASPLLDVKKTKVVATTFPRVSGAIILLKIDTEVELECSYTLKPFLDKLHLEEEFKITFNQSESDEDNEVIYVSGTSLNIDKIVFDLIKTSIPLAPKSPDATLPQGGEGYFVYKEDDYKKEKVKNNNPFSKIDIDLEE